jgi:hypothetical protein
MYYTFCKRCEIEFDVDEATDDTCPHCGSEYDWETTDKNDDDDELSLTDNDDERSLTEFLPDDGEWD